MNKEQLSSLIIAIVFLLALLISKLNAYPVWSSGQSMCPPDCSDGWRELNTSVKPEQMQIGQTACWQLKPDQLNYYWGGGQEKINTTKLALSLALGLPIKQKNWRMMSGTICHALIQKNATHFITQGTNSKINSHTDDFNMTWAKNYIGRLEARP